MPQLLVRELDQEVVGLLKRRAAANGRSAEAEHRAILEAALRPDAEPLWKVAERLRKQTEGRGGPTGTEIIRQYRDTRMIDRG